MCKDSIDKLDLMRDISIHQVQQDELRIMSNNWEKNHFVSMARISNWRAVQRKRNGNYQGAMESREESKYLMTIARTY